MWIKELVKSNKFFSRFLLGLLALCLLVILGGAWVRISHSGDGCGQNWPSCQGEYLIDFDKSKKTNIEWLHRATSGLFGISTLLLFVLSFIKYPKAHPLRKTSVFILFFTINEALIGAFLVLKGLTGSNVSFSRTLTTNLHFLNSLFLTSSLFIGWRLSLDKKFSWRKARKNKPHFFFGLLGFVFLASLGALSSLASSLFPSTSLSQGLALDFNPQSHWLIRFRMLHPLLAFLLGGGFLLYLLNTYLRPIHRLKELFFKKTAQNLLVLFLSLALLTGLSNLLFLSPVFLKLSHLFIAYILSWSFLRNLEIK